MFLFQENPINSFSVDSKPTVITNALNCTLYFKSLRVPNAIDTLTFFAIFSEKTT